MVTRANSASEFGRNLNSEKAQRLARPTEQQRIMSETQREGNVWQADTQPEVSNRESDTQ